MSGITDKHRVNGYRISCENCKYWRTRWPLTTGCFCSLTHELQDYWDKCDKFDLKERLKHG